MARRDFEPLKSTWNASSLPGINPKIFRRQDLRFIDFRKGHAPLQRWMMTRVVACTSYAVQALVKGIRLSGTRSIHSQSIDGERGHAEKSELFRRVKFHSLVARNNNNNNNNNNNHKKVK